MFTVCTAGKREMTKDKLSVQGIIAGLVNSLGSNQSHSCGLPQAQWKLTNYQGPPVDELVAVCPDPSPYGMVATSTTSWPFSDFAFNRDSLPLWAVEKRGE